MRSVFRSRWGCTFVTAEGSFHSFRDLGLLPAAPSNFGAAEPEITRLPVPGVSVTLDLSESLTGYVAYRDRAPELAYFLTGTEGEREALRRRAMSLLLGRSVQIIPDESPEGFWAGRLTADPPVHGEGADTLTITGYLDPYKYERWTTTEDWLWDPFSFETGVIREYGSIEVDGTATVTVLSSPMGGSPAIKASAAMTMTVGGVEYSLIAGTNRFETLELPHSEKEVEFTFSGTGTVSIDFRGGYL